MRFQREFSFTVGLCALLVAGCGARNVPVVPFNEPAGDPRTVRICGLEMVRVPPGRYLMGPGAPASSEGDAPGDGDLRPPPQAVQFSEPFYLSQFEITKSEWEQVMGTRPWASRPHVSDQHLSPAVFVTFHDAREFCARLSQATGLHWRLPTEAEWEYARRAGAATDYPFGNAADSQGTLAAHEHLRQFFREEFPWTPLVGIEEPNAWDFHDLGGNVREWCSAHGPGNATKAALRGDGWRTVRPLPAWASESAQPYEKGDDIGFRVACDGPLQAEAVSFFFSRLAPGEDTKTTLTEAQAARYAHPGAREAHNGKIAALAVSPEGGLVASACWDMQLKLWSVAGQKKLGQWHAGIVWHRMRLSAGGRFVACTDAFRDVQAMPEFPYEITFSQIWDLEAGEDVRTFHDECIDLCFSPDGNWFAFLGLETLELFSAGNWSAPVRVVPGMGEHLQLRGPTRIAFSGDGETITVLSTISRKTYRVADGELLAAASIESELWPIEVAAFHFGEPALVLAANIAHTQFARFHSDRADMPPYHPPVPHFLGPRDFTPDGRHYIEYDRATGLRIMTVPFFAEVLRLDMPVDELCPLPQRGEIVAAAGRHLFLLSLSEEPQLGYFVEDHTDTNE